MDSLGKEKADMTHIKCNLKPQDAIKVKSNDESNYKIAGARDRQSQDDKHRYELHVVEDHEKGGQFPKVDVEGNQKTWMSENLQSKRCNRLTGRWSKAGNEEENPQTTPFSSKAPKRSPNLEPIVWDVDVASLLTPRRPCFVSSLDETCGHMTICNDYLM